MNNKKKTRASWLEILCFGLAGLLAVIFLIAASLAGLDSAVWRDSDLIIFLPEWLRLLPLIVHVVATGFWVAAILVRLDRGPTLRTIQKLHGNITAEDVARLVMFDIVVGPASVLVLCWVLRCGLYVFGYIPNFFPVVYADVVLMGYPVAMFLAGLCFHMALLSFICHLIRRDMPARFVLYNQVFSSWYSPPKDFTAKDLSNELKRLGKSFSEQEKESIRQECIDQSWHVRGMLSTDEHFIKLQLGKWREEGRLELRRLGKYHISYRELT